MNIITDVKILNNYFLLITLNDQDQIIFDASIGFRKDEDIMDNYDKIRNYDAFRNELGHNDRFVTWGDDGTCYNLPFILEHCEFVKKNQIARCCELELYIYNDNEILCVHRAYDQSHKMKYEEALIDINTKYVKGSLNIRCMNFVFKFIDKNKTEIDAMIKGIVPCGLISTCGVCCGE